MGSILLDRFFPATYNLRYALSGLHCMLCISLPRILVPFAL